MFIQVWVSQICKKSIFYAVIFNVQGVEMDEIRKK